MSPRRRELSPAPHDRVRQLAVDVTMAELRDELRKAFTDFAALAGQLIAMQGKPMRQQAAELTLTELRQLKDQFLAEVGG